METTKPGTLTNLLAKCKETACRLTSRSRTAQQQEESQEMITKYSELLAAYRSAKPILDRAGGGRYLEEEWLEMAKQYDFQCGKSVAYQAILEIAKEDADYETNLRLQFVSALKPEWGSAYDYPQSDVDYLALHRPENPSPALAFVLAELCGSEPEE